MKTVSTQQEILLVTGTSFTSRELSETIDGLNYNCFTENEKWINACWNGLLREMLPEVFEQDTHGKLYLRDIREAASFIEIDIGETTDTLEKEFSIDPYTFLPAHILS
jgi:hypothetical protein